MKTSFLRLSLIAAFLLAVSTSALAFQQQPPQRATTKMGGAIADALRELVETPAVSGYEQSVGKKIVARIKAMPQKYDAPPFELKTDNMGNITVTVGSGEPKRLVVAPIDEPGFVVSGITPEG